MNFKTIINNTTPKNARLPVVKYLHAETGGGKD